MVIVDLGSGRQAACERWLQSGLPLRHASYSAENTHKNKQQKHNMSKATPNTLKFDRLQCTYM